MEAYLMSVSNEVSSYLAQPTVKPDFVAEVIQRLEASGVQSKTSQDFVFRGLHSLVNSRLLEDVREIKTSIQNHFSKKPLQYSTSITSHDTVTYGHIGLKFILYIPLLLLVSVCYIIILF